MVNSCCLGSGRQAPSVRLKWRGRGERGARSTEVELAEVDGDEERVGYLLHRVVIGIDATLRRHLDALEGAIVSGVVGAGGTPEDVNGIVVTAHQSIRTKMRDLRPRVALDVVREGHPEAAPNLPVLLPRLDLFADKARIGVKEGRGEIGPESLDGEICDMEFVPGRFANVPLEGRVGVVAHLTDVAFECFQRQAIRYEHAAVSRRRERRNRKALRMGVDLEQFTLEQIRLLLDLPNGTADRHLGAQL